MKASETRLGVRLADYIVVPEVLPKEIEAKMFDKKLTLTGEKIDKYTRISGAGEHLSKFELGDDPPAQSEECFTKCTSPLSAAVAPL